MKGASIILGIVDQRRVSMAISGDFRDENSSYFQKNMAHGYEHGYVPGKGGPFRFPPLQLSLPPSKAYTFVSPVLLATPSSSQLDFPKVISHDEWHRIRACARDLGANQK